MGIQHSHAVTHLAHLQLPQILEKAITLATLLTLHMHTLPNQPIPLTLPTQPLHINQLINPHLVSVILLQTILAQEPVLGHQEQFLGVVQDFLLVAGVYTQLVVLVLQSGEIGVLVLYDEVQFLYLLLQKLWISKPGVGGLQFG